MDCAGEKNPFGASRTVSLSDKQKLIDDCLKKSYEIALGNAEFGYCLVVNADTALSELRSELGHFLWRSEFLHFPYVFQFLIRGTIGDFIMGVFVVFKGETMS
ncbi:hypothetical protein JHK87_040236 [Glycine soja]|nr:hypothetical protein JHK87_040236 [Glycine soja]